MRSLSTRLAVTISCILLVLVLSGGLWLEKSLSQVIHKQGMDQAQTHAQSILGSLQTLMLNGNGTLARDWLNRLQGVAGIKDISVLRRDGSTAFTDLTTVDKVNAYLGVPRFRREPAQPTTKSALPSGMFQQALNGSMGVEFDHGGDITVAMPIEASVECYSCHGYDGASLRGVLKLSLSNKHTEIQIESMRTFLWSGIAVVMLILALALYASLRINVLRPIEVFQAAIKRAAQGDRDVQVELNRQDELGELAKVFNQMQEALSLSEVQTKAVMQNVLDGILMISPDGHVEMANPAACRIFAYQHDELIGRSVQHLVPSSAPINEQILDLNYREPRVVMLGVAREITGIRKNESTFPMDIAVSEMIASNRHYYIAVVRDITTRKARTAALRYQALHDPLTDLPNRSFLMERLQEGLRLSNQSGLPLSLLLMDLDRFKEVNDTLGHHVGDKLLQQVAMRLREVVRETDTVARLGGDEFGIVLPSADAEQAAKVAYKLVKQVDRAIIIEGQHLSVGASVGIVCAPHHGDDPVLLLQRADVAMYQAKHGSRDFAVYDVNEDPHSLRQLAIGSELRLAIEEGQLLLYYQPKLDLKTNKLSGFEVLVRWAHPKHGLLTPDEFIPLAEQNGLIRPLTLWVFERALHDCRDPLLKRVNCQLSINISARNLNDPRFPEEVARIVAESKVDPYLIKLEITETAVMEDPDRALLAMEKLCNIGFRLSIDDFGIGYSSLTYLKRLPVNELKIDKSFGMSIVNESNSKVIVRSTIDMAHQLGLRVVAEGVESLEAFNILQELGCDAVQGYYLARPMALPETMSWLQAVEHPPETVH